MQDLDEINSWQTQIVERKAAPGRRAVIVTPGIRGGSCSSTLFQGQQHNKCGGHQQKLVKESEGQQGMGRNHSPSMALGGWLSCLGGCLLLKYWGIFWEWEAMHNCKFIALCLHIWSKLGEFRSPEPKRKYGPISNPFNVLTEISIMHITNPMGSHPLTMYVLRLWAITAKYTALFFLFCCFSPLFLTKQDLRDCISLRVFLSQIHPSHPPNL